jgi:hypothetical protein
MFSITEGSGADHNPRISTSLIDRHFALHDARGQVHPLLLAVAHRGQANPFQDALLIAADFKHKLGGRSVQEVNPAAPPLSFEEKATHAAAGQACEIIRAADQRKASQLNEALVAAGQVTPQTQETLAVLAKAVQSRVNRLAVRPTDLVTFEMNIASLPIARGVAAE